MRKVMKLELFCLFLQAFIFIFLILHDWVPLGDLNDVQAVQSVNTTSELLFLTALNSVPFAIAFFLCCYYAGKVYPFLMKLFLIIYFPALLSVSCRHGGFPTFLELQQKRSNDMKNCLARHMLFYQK
ncbi:hypothetical protein H1Z61_05975 [Bacillus aquiflavi]|uniref:Uncharacterized protein n=1 Tax=Bacillus aquiflavi TaxID=2672567 RepID=A0A6B3VZN4_9BACI|nr:hypothetical protein [Bacillus aquiflavi]MBA4536703.1 hypothetical protein [Bacillus aquiflavi]NEY81071.1 hypothetical protein [Bacillus aquiflavi]UAC48738.1 hypothetical protein K6959_01825 [Bacillus aquiflavi]